MVRIWQKGAKEELHAVSLNYEKNSFSVAPYVPRAWPYDLYEMFSVQSLHLIIL